MALGIESTVVKNKKHLHNSKGNIRNNCICVRLRGSRLNETNRSGGALEQLMYCITHGQTFRRRSYLVA